MKLLRWIKSISIGIALVAACIAIWFLIKFLVIVGAISLIAAGIYYSDGSD